MRCSNCLQVTVFLFLGFVYSCATIVTPSGGPKDVIAPKLLYTLPADGSTKNYGIRTLVFVFDEFVVLDAPQNTILVSPYTSQKIETKVIGKKVKISFPEGLKENTSYNVKLKRAIKDFREGNYLSEISLSFSTGEILDTGKLMVHTKNLGEKSEDENTMVCLVKNKSDFYGKNYKYISSISSGMAKFTNLDQNPYFVYAFADSNRNKKWDKAEPVAFYSKRATAEDEGIRLTLFNDEQEEVIFQTNALSSTEYDLDASQDINNLKLVNEEGSIYKKSNRKYKVILKDIPKNGEIELQYDDVENKKIKLPESEYEKSIKLIEESRGFKLAKRTDSAFFSLNSYIDHIDRLKVMLIREEDTVVPNMIVYKNNIVLKDLDRGKNYSLLIDSFALRYNNISNQPIRVSFSTYHDSSYFGKVTINVDSSIQNLKYPIIYLRNGNDWIKQGYTKKIAIKNHYGNAIFFKVISDENNNGYWNTGNIKRELQPEPMFMEQIMLQKGKESYNLKIKEI